MATIVEHGDGKYLVIVRRVGFPKKSKVFKKKADAEKWGRKIESEMDANEFTVQDNVSGAELVMRYRDEVAKEMKGARWAIIRLNRFLKTAHWLQKQIPAITDKDVRDWKNARLKKVSDGTVRREMTQLSAVFTYAKKEWGVKMRANPLSLVTWPEDSKPRNRRPASDELDALLEHFDFDLERPPKVGWGHGKQATPWVLLLAIETAMRLGEICAIKWEDVNFEERWVHIPDSKNGTERWAPLTPLALEMMEALFNAPRHAPVVKKRDFSKYYKPKKERKADAPAYIPIMRLDRSAYVFAVNGFTVGEHFRSACTELGIEDLRFHDQRHEATTRLAGIFEILPLAKITGHKDPKQLMTYYNPTGKELADTLHGVEAIQHSAKFQTSELIRRAKKDKPEKDKKPATPEAEGEEGGQQ